MIKILYIGGEDANQKGAVGTHTNGIIKALDTNNLISLHTVFYKYSMPIYTGKDFSICSKSKPKMVFFKIYNILAYVIFIRKIVHCKTIDYIYFRFDPFFYFFFSLFSWDQKIIVEYNDVFLDQINFAIRKGEWSRFGRLVRSSKFYKKFILSTEKKAFARSHLTVVVTHGLLKYCNYLFESKKYLILNNATNVKVDTPINQIKGKLKLSHVGTLTHWDGLEELIDALILAKTIDKYFDYEFSIIGDGSLKESLLLKIRENNLANNIIFKPSVSHNEAISHLLTIDVVPLLKTIDSYGLSPIKYYEALGLGCYLVVSNIEHINEVPDFAGSVVSFPLDVCEIAKALITISNNIDSIRKNRMKIANYANNYHTWDMRINELLKYL